MNPLLLHFLLSKNVKVRLAEYLRYNFGFVIYYTIKELKQKLIMSTTANPSKSQTQKTSLKRRRVDDYNVL